VLIGAFAQQQYAVLARDLKFFTLAIIDLACVLAGFATAIVCALIWQSYWALWASGVASSLLWTVASTAVSSWRPSAPWRRADTDGLLRFGAKLTGVSVIEFLADNIDKALIGRVAGVIALGFYDRAFKLLLFPLQNVSWPLGRIAVPVLSRLRDEPERMRSAYLGFIGQVNLVTVPGVAAALVTSATLIPFLLGEEWAPSAEVFAWLGVIALVQPMAGSVYWLLTVQGRTRDMFRCALINAAVVVCAVLIGLQDGAVGVARALAIAELLVRAPVLIEIVCRGGPMRRLDFALAAAPFALAAGATWGVSRWLALAGLDDLVFMIAVGCVSYGLTAVALFAFESGRATLRNTMGVVDRALAFLPQTART
jgi:PST family polysaccharide transporter